MNRYGKLLSMIFNVYMRASLTIVYRELRMQKRRGSPKIRLCPFNALNNMNKKLFLCALARFLLLGSLASHGKHLLSVTSQI